MDANFTQARDFFLSGIAHYQAGRYDRAEQQFAAALVLVPGRVSALTNLGAARLKLGRADEALAVLDEALAQEPDNIEALSHRGAALAELGRRDEALRALDRSLVLDPSQGTAWSHRGSVLKEQGRHAEAIASFEKAIAHGADPQLNAWYLAALRPGDTPKAPPRHYVQALFDGYAGQFDQHLVEHLHYDAPGVLARRIAGMERRFARALDLGCGTGLCGPCMQPMCDAIDGVELSSAMLEKAARLGVYASLEQADAVQFLQATQHRYGLVVSADVLIYVGDLAALFEGVARVMEPGGIFACTVELAGDADDFVLQPSLRYAHSERYLRTLAQACGLSVVQMERRTVREDQRVAIPGLFAWFVKA